MNEDLRMSMYFKVVCTMGGRAPYVMRRKFIDMVIRMYKLSRTWDNRLIENYGR